MINDECQTANGRCRTGGEGFRRPAFTLLETLLAATVTSLVAASGAAMVFAVTSASSQTRDLRSTKMAGHYALSLISKTIRESRVVAGVTSTSVTLWLDDSNGDDVVNAGELAFIKYDPVTKQIVLETLDPNSTVNPALVISNSDLIDATQLQLLVPDSEKTPTAWADGVESLVFTGYPSLTETRIVGTRFTIGVGADEVAFQSTASPRASADYLFLSQTFIPPNGPSGRTLRKYYSRWDGYLDVINAQTFTISNQQIQVVK